MSESPPPRRWIWAVVAALGFGAALAFGIHEWRTRALSMEKAASVPDPNAGWDVTKVDTDDFSQEGYGLDRVHLRSGETLDHIGYGLKYLGRLMSPTGSPGLLFSGHQCVHCQEGLLLLLYSAQWNQVATFGYPAGKVTDDEGELEYSGRAFFGKCLNGFDGVVAFGKIKQDDGSWRDTVQLYSFEPDGTFTAKIPDQGLPAIEDTFSRIGHEPCSELPQVDYQTTESQ